MKICDYNNSNLLAEFQGKPDIIKFKDNDYVLITLYNDNLTLKGFLYKIVSRSNLVIYVSIKDKLSITEE